jgi:hypothetical protein
MPSLLDKRSSDGEKTGMIRWALILLMAILPSQLNANPLDLPEHEQQALMEKQLFPLLQEADQVVIYSLYPIQKKSLKKAVDTPELMTAFGLYDEKDVATLDPADRAAAEFARKAETFEGYPVLGKVDIKEAEDRLKILKEIRMSMLPWQDSEDCHEPRHGILIVKGSQRLRFSICFSCSNSYLIGAPASAADAVKVFSHFRSGFRDHLEGWLDTVGAARMPFKLHPVKPAK